MHTIERAHISVEKAQGRPRPPSDEAQAGSALRGGSVFPCSRSTAITSSRDASQEPITSGLVNTMTSFQFRAQNRTKGRLRRERVCEATMAGVG
jgi:hypothetical protein